MEQAKIFGSTHRVSKTGIARARKSRHYTPLPKWVGDMFNKFNDGSAPTPDPVHGVGSSNLKAGDAFNGQLLTGTTYRVGTVIGTGHFGQVRLARNIKTNEQLAVKIERNVKYPHLATEWQMYQTLNKTQAQGIPTAFHFGPCGDCQALVLELLGPSLEQIFTLCGRKFSEQTILLIAVQMITRLEHMHFNSIINRDIKPSNLLISKPPKLDKTIFVVDFGTAKHYRDPKTKRHVPYKIHKNLTGTPKFMSLRAHEGIEATRRDDLESLGYMLIYFLRGTLPWRGLRGKYMLDMKKSVRLEDLCKEQPTVFLDYMKYVRSLEFDEKPDYYYLRRLFLDRLREEGYSPDGVMDWSHMVGDVKQYRQLQRMSHV